MKSVHHTILDNKEKQMTVCNCKGWWSYHYDEETKTIKGSGCYYHSYYCKGVNVRWK